MTIRQMAGAGCAVLLALAANAVEQTQYNGMKYFGSPNDWISVRLEGYSTEELPAVYADDSVRTIIVRHEVPDIRGDFGPNGFPFAFDGELTVKIRSWDGAFEKTVATRRTPDYWRYGQEMSFSLNMKDLKPGAYVVTAELPPHILADRVFNPTNCGNGSIGKSMLYGRNAMRLAVFENIPPAKIFGVGNGMIHNDLWWSGYPIENDLEARELKPVMVGGEDAFHNAIIGCPGTEGLFIDSLGPTNVPAMNNPVAKMLDIFSEPGRAELKRRAEEMGRRLGRNAGIAGVKLGNEAPQFNRGGVCPTEAADASFRDFCKARYNGDLQALNAAWGKAFKDWQAVRQPIYAEEQTTVEKQGAAAIDWYANMGLVGDKLVKYLNLPENVEMAMDWYRWRTKESIRMYADYVAEAKKYDKKTFYSNNYCWPNFFAHLVLPSWRRMDGAELDCQYICKLPRTLGSDEEMLEILEMTESAMKGRPIVGREIYVQPDFPTEMPAMQNWAMVAHGMTVNLVFAWKPYSDHAGVFKNGPKAWTRPEDAKPMWMLIDTDGTRLPVYYSVKRSAEEIAAFHAKYDGLSLKRTHGRVAVYLSDETSMYTMLKTGDRPFCDAVLCHTRDWLADELRMAGVRIEYLDDETIGELTRKDFDVVVIPPMPRVAPAPAAQLAAFEKAGGGVIRLEGKDPELIAKHPELPRSAWFEPADGGKPNVEIVVRTQAKTGRRFIFVLNRGKAVKGTLSGTDFAKGASLTDALTGEKSGRELALGDYGYRVFFVDMIH